MVSPPGERSQWLRVSLYLYLAFSPPSKSKVREPPPKPWWFYVSNELARQQPGFLGIE